MKKLFGLIMAIFIAIALTACNKEETPETTDATATTADTTTVATTDTANEDAAPEEDKGIFASIRDAVDKSIPLKCTYTDEEGVSATMYIKGNVMRADAIKTQPTDPMVSEIIKDNKVYIWSDASDQGILIDFAKMQPGDDSFKMGDESIKSADDILNRMEEQKQNCVKEVVSDSIFDVPTNIKFLGGGL